MKRLTLAVLAVLAVSSLANAQSAKSAVSISNTTLIAATTGTGGWTDILNTSIKTSEQKDLMLGVSLETGLFTRTLVKSKNGVADTQSAQAQVEVRVVLDPGTSAERTAEPGAVTFDKRFQQLMAVFGGVMNCGDTNGDGIITVDECTFTDEELELILDTMGAHHFNFALTDVGAATHTVKVQARVTTDASSLLQAGATGSVGKGAVTVEEVRLVKDAVIIQ